MSEVAEKSSKAAAKASAVAAAPAVPAKARAVVVDPQRMKVAEYVRREWVVTAEEGTSVDDILHPGYWAHMARDMSMYDRIEVRIDTGEFLLELLVKNKGPNWAQVALLQHHDLVGVGADEAAALEEIDILFKGPIRKWCAIRKSDGEVLQDKFESKLAAGSYAAQYEISVLAR